MLTHLGLEDELYRMVEFGWSNRLLYIEELIYCDVTLEVVSTFEVDKSPMGFLSLGIFSSRYSMSSNALAT